MDRKSTQREEKEVAVDTAFAVRNSFMRECKKTESEMGLGWASPAVSLVLNSGTNVRYGSLVNSFICVLSWTLRDIFLGGKNRSDKSVGSLQI